MPTFIAEPRWKSTHFMAFSIFMMYFDFDAVCSRRDGRPVGPPGARRHAPPPFPPCLCRYAPLVRASVVRGEGVAEAMELVIEAGRWRRERLVGAAGE